MFPNHYHFLIPNEKEVRHRYAMKGYITAMGYMGYVEGRYLLFCSEADYMDYIRELTEMDTPAEAA